MVNDLHETNSTSTLRPLYLMILYIDNNPVDSRAVETSARWRGQNRGIRRINREFARRDPTIE